MYKSQYDVKYKEKNAEADYVFKLRNVTLLAMLTMKF